MRHTRSRIAALVLLALLSSTVAGCTLLGRIGGGIGSIFTPNRRNDFAEANLRIKAKEAKYTEQRLVVVDADGNPRQGILTEAQYRKFQAFEQNVIDATGPVYEDILEWRRTNTRPVSYDGHERTLFAAIDELIAFVKREAVKP